MKTKKLLLACAVLTTFTLSVSAQGFAKFSADNALSEGSIKFAKEGPSKVEIIVGEQADLKNINFKYKLLSGSSIENELSKDFTNPQTVTVNKNDGTSKEWIIVVKKLAPATLPLTIAFDKVTPAVWTSATKGWVNSGTDETKPMVVRFGNKNVSFITAFNNAAKEVSFDLNLVSKTNDKFNGKFEVSTSVDGKDWKELSDFNNDKLTTDSHFSCSVPSDARFIKWNYKEREKQNVNLNNITIN
ncbi:MAG: hypothetical protein RSA92_02615 [Bacteroidaceae bacterium]